MTLTRLTLTATVALLGACGLANAQIIAEIEPNNSFVGAQVLPPGGFPGADLVLGSIAPDPTPGGIDFFSFPVAVSGHRVLLSLFDDTAALADSRIGLFNPAGVLIASASTAGPVNIDSGSLTLTGQYRVAVTGALDTGFTGAHTVQFGYNLLVGVTIPAPGAAAVLVMGGVLSFRRRRR